MNTQDFTEKTRGIRIQALRSIYTAGSGHPGGLLSSIDLIYYLFSCEMKYSINNMNTIDRDHFILSKGHAAPALYAVAAAMGILKNDSLIGLRKLNNPLQGHPHRKTTPWVEASTGSLGQGFSFAIGEALGLRLRNLKRRVYVMLGDGELDEGEIWEGVMFAAHHRLDNLCAVIDYNKMQSDDLNVNIMNLEPLAEKWKAFNWQVLEIDGHDEKAMVEAFQGARETKNKPTIIVAHTVKGKGVSFMEKSPLWHGSLKLSDEDYRLALVELGATDDLIREYIHE